MDNRVQFVIFMTIVAGTVCHAISCYVCNSCPEPFRPELVNIQTDCNSCKKVKINDDVERSCSVQPLQSRCESISGFAITTETCYCVVDLCNGVTTTKVSSGIATVIAILTYAISKAGFPGLGLEYM